MDKETLGTETGFGTVEPITSNDEEFCLRCGVTITKENDSGWQAFKKDGRTTQKVCKGCEVKPKELTEEEKKLVKDTEEMLKILLEEIKAGHISNLDFLADELVDCANHLRKKKKT